MSGSLEKLKTQLLVKYKEFLGDRLSLDLEIQIENIARQEAGLLQLALSGVDITNDMKHVHAQFANLLAKKRLKTIQEGREIFRIVYEGIRSIGVQILADVAKEINK
jgi:hypothetical protein